MNPLASQIEAAAGATAEGAPQTSRPTGPYAIRSMTASAEDLARFCDCFNNNGSQRTLAHLRWQYQSSFGPLSVLVAEHGTDPALAAIYAMIAVPFWNGTDATWALQSLDTLTAEAHRGKGLFGKMATQAYAHADAQGAACVYGFPNGNSAPGFFGKLGWQNLDPLPFMVRPLRSRYLAQRLRLPIPTPDVPLSLARAEARPPRGTELVGEPRFDEQFTMLWRRCVGAHVGVDRTAAYLRWRLARPGVNYRTLALYRNGQLAAYIVYTIYDKHNGRVGYIMELLGDRQRDMQYLLQRALGHIRKADADIVLAWSLPTTLTHQALGRSWFVPFPERFRPIELHFGARGFGSYGGQASAALHQRSNWYISYLDSDTV